MNRVSTVMIEKPSTEMAAGGIEALARMKDGQGLRADASTGQARDENAGPDKGSPARFGGENKCMQHSEYEGRVPCIAVVGWAFVLPFW